MNTLIFFFLIRSSTTITRSLHSFYFKFIPIPVFNIILNSLLVCVVLVAVKMSYIFRQLVTHILIWKKLWGYKICQNPPNESSELIREFFFPLFMILRFCQLCVHSTTSAGRSCQYPASLSPSLSRRWRRLRETVQCIVDAWRELQSTVLSAGRNK